MAEPAPPPLAERVLVIAEVPPDWKVTRCLRQRTKHVLRRALAGIVPDEVLTDPKRGFGAPHDHWLAHDLREMVDDLRSEDQIRRRSLFRPASVRMLVREHRDGRRDWSYQLWQLLTLKLWQRAFLDR